MLNLFILLAFIFCFRANIIFIIFIIVILIFLNKDLIKQIYTTKKFMKENTMDKLEKLEKDLSDNYLIYDGWYLTNEYMFSVRILKEINYKDIVVVEERLALVRGNRGQVIGKKQVIYLKNGEEYKLKSQFMSGYQELFTEFIKQKNTSTYFGIIEDYLKIKKDHKL